MGYMGVFVIYLLYIFYLSILATEPLRPTDKVLGFLTKSEDFLKNNTDLKVYEIAAKAEYGNMNYSSQA